MVAWHVIGSAHSARNHPLSPSRSRSPSYQPKRRDCIDAWKLKHVLCFLVILLSLCFWCSMLSVLEHESQLPRSPKGKWPLASACLCRFKTASSNRYEVHYVRQILKRRVKVHDDAVKAGRWALRWILKQVSAAIERAREQDGAIKAREAFGANVPSSTVCETSTTSATWRDSSSGCLAV